MAYSTQRQVDAHPGPFLLLPCKQPSLKTEDREGVNREGNALRCREIEVRSVWTAAISRPRPEVCTSFSEGMWARMVQRELSFTSPFSCKFCPRINLPGNLCGQTSWRFSFPTCPPASPISHDCVFAVVVSRFLSAHIFYIGHDFAQRGILQDTGEEYTP